MTVLLSLHVDILDLGSEDHWVHGASIWADTWYIMFQNGLAFLEGGYCLAFDWSFICLTTMFESPMDYLDDYVSTSISMAFRRCLSVTQPSIMW